MAEVKADLDAAILKRLNVNAETRLRGQLNAVRRGEEMHAKLFTGAAARVEGERDA
jgi:hypothetical protein